MYNLQSTGIWRLTYNHNAEPAEHPVRSVNTENSIEPSISIIMYRIRKQLLPSNQLLQFIHSFHSCKTQHSSSWCSSVLASSAMTCSCACPAAPCHARGWYMQVILAFSHRAISAFVCGVFVIVVHIGTHSRARTHMCSAGSFCDASCTWAGK